MKKKKLLSLFLCLCLFFGLLPASASAAVSVELYDGYSDGMLFRQNAVSSVAGVCRPGVTLKLQLLNAAGALVTESSAVSDGSGQFSLSFQAPAGGYAEYSLRVLRRTPIGYVTEAELSHVVFGELWLGSGQSNMSIPLPASTEWAAESAAGDRGSPWLRFLVRGEPLTIRGSMNGPADPQEELPGCFWVSGGTDEMDCVGAVDYYFAKKLQQALKVPVGVLCMDYGGSTIAAWLSRSVIESDPSVYNILAAMGWYIPKEAWDALPRPLMSTMTANYDSILYPLRRLSVTGMIWYQGESDTHLPHGWYSVLLAALQRCIGETFSHEGTLPLICTTLAAYHYAHMAETVNEPQDFNSELAEFVQQQPQSRALITISDIDLFYGSNGCIHPAVKKPVGDRFAAAAAALVYGADGPASAPLLKSSRIEGDSVYVTLENVGDGLCVNGTALRGFSLCGADGVYYAAEAELISADTVRIYHADIPEPKAVSYAYSKLSLYDTLFSTKGGSPCLPCVPFLTDRSYAAHFHAENGWEDCDAALIWRLPVPDEYTGRYDPWVSEGCTAEVQAESAYSGSGGLHVSGSSGSFSVQQCFELYVGGADCTFHECDRDWSDFGRLSFQVRNTGTTPLTLCSCRVHCADGSVLTPVLQNTFECSAVIPADGAWHELTLDLCLTQTADGRLIAAPIDSAVWDFSLNFEGEGCDLDEFRFRPAAVCGGDPRCRLYADEAGLHCLSYAPAGYTLLLAQYNAAGRLLSLRAEALSGALTELTQNRYMNSAECRVYILDSDCVPFSEPAVLSLSPS